MAIIVFQHSPNCTPGRLGLTLRDHSFDLDIRRLDLPVSATNPHVPGDFDDVEGYREYAEHPAHLAVVEEHFRPIIGERVTVQVEH